jgi:predicted TPR repeat methyltransferase
MSRHNISALQRAINSGPYDPRAYAELCQVLCAAGRADYAADIFKRWARIDPKNPTVDYMKAGCLGTPAPARAPEEYVKEEFNLFSLSYDRVLHQLNYVVPRLVAEEMTRVFAPRRELEILDGGCGTGLCGRELRPYAHTLVGVDLSEGMLRHAHYRGVYDEIVRAELRGWLETQRQRFDVIVLADVLIYFGELKSVFEAAAAALKRNGTIIFSTEAPAGNNSESSFYLNAAGRYGHGENYLREVLDQSGFTICTLALHVIRNEDRQVVKGFVVRGQGL